MPEIMQHQAEGVWNNLRIFSENDPDPTDGTFNLYRVSAYVPGTVNFNDTPIRFQKGDPQKVGVNGIYEKGLLAILIDRLVCRQNKGVISTDDEKALSLMNQAMTHLLGVVPKAEPAKTAKNKKMRISKK